LLGQFPLPLVQLGKLAQRLGRGAERRSLLLKYRRGLF
jgi:hypothetical protein